jgi:hypothetical protein
MMLWLLSALGWAKRLFGLVLRYPLHCALIASLALSAALWVRGNRYRDKTAECAAGRVADRRAYTAAQAEAARLAKEAKARQEARYTRLAKEADDDHAKDLADARRAAERYIDRMRVKSAGSASGGTVASAEGGDPGVSQGLPADAVMVSAADVRTCTDAVAYGIAARTWALGLDAD